MGSTENLHLEAMYVQYIITCLKETKTLLKKKEKRKSHRDAVQSIKPKRSENSLTNMYGQVKRQSASSSDVNGKEGTQDSKSFTTLQTTNQRKSKKNVVEKKKHRCKCK